MAFHEYIWFFGNAALFSLLRLSHLSVSSPAGDLASSRRTTNRRTVRNHRSIRLQALSGCADSLRARRRRSTVRSITREIEASRQPRAGGICKSFESSTVTIAVSWSIRQNGTGTESIPRYIRLDGRTNVLSSSFL